MENSIPKIIKYNTTGAGYRAGEYVLPQNITQTIPYLNIFFFKGYILASALNYPPRLFNETSYAYIGSLNLSETFDRGEYLASRDVFVFLHRQTGKVGYFRLNTLPLVLPVYLQNDTIKPFGFMMKSTDEKYITVSMRISPYSLLIYRVSDWVLVSQPNLSSTSATQAWSTDGRYIMVFVYHSLYITVYDSLNNWTMIANVSIGYKNIRTCFQYD